MKLRLKNQEGFTLIELMIVVAIISILATLALPRFQVFQAKALRSEATYNLGVIATYEEAYRIENQGYARVNQMGVTAAGANAGDCNVDNPIGFQLTNCSKVKYDYGTIDVDAANTDNDFEAQARSTLILSGLTDPDCLQINQDRESTIERDAITEQGTVCAGNIDS